MEIYIWTITVTVHAQNMTVSEALFFFFFNIGNLFKEEPFGLASGQ
jgi:hypothetical protein